MSQEPNGFKIVTGRNSKMLRSPARPVIVVDAEVRELVRRMRGIMKQVNGIGLAAPQIGVPLQIFVAEVNNKFYALINPKLLKSSSECDVLEEGCLSVPGTYGVVERPLEIVVSGLNQRGKKVKIKARGLLARVFQHEIDHLNGALFVDKATKVSSI